MQLRVRPNSICFVHIFGLNDGNEKIYNSWISRKKKVVETSMNCRYVQ